jgi:hypothetical protein
MGAGTRTGTWYCKVPGMVMVTIVLHFMVRWPLFSFSNWVFTFTVRVLGYNRGIRIIIKAKLKFSSNKMALAAFQSTVQYPKGPQ